MSKETEFKETKGAEVFKETNLMPDYDKYENAMAMANALESQNNELRERLLKFYKSSNILRTTQNDFLKCSYIECFETIVLTDKRNLFNLNGLLIPLCPPHLKTLKNIEILCHM